MKQNGFNKSVKDAQKGVKNMQKNVQKSVKNSKGFKKAKEVQKKSWFKQLWPLALIAVVFIGTATVFAGTMVPGHQKKVDKGITDTDGNGYPDAGVEVNGKYTSLYAYDANGDWYWDLGDGRVQGTVDSVDALDANTMTSCDYQVQYRGGFENDPFLDNGWIMNNINCSGYDDNNKYNYLIVHESDPRYRGNPDNAVWGTWEYKTNTVSGLGNLARPETPVGAN